MGKIFVLAVIVAVSGIAVIFYTLFAADHPDYKTKILSVEYINRIAQTKILELTAEKRALRTAGTSIYALASVECDKQKLSNLIKCVALWTDARRWRPWEHEVLERNTLRQQLEGSYILAREPFSAGDRNVKIGQEGLLLLGVLKTEEVVKGVCYE